jgi:hypothetical protein
MTQTDIPTLEDIDSAFTALVLPDLSDFNGSWPRA